MGWVSTYPATCRKTNRRQSHPERFQVVVEWWAAIPSPKRAETRPFNSSSVVGVLFKMQPVALEAIC